MAKTLQKVVDWSYIIPLIRAGLLSNSEISRQYNSAYQKNIEFKKTVSEAAIRKFIKTSGVKRDLAERVRKEVREKLVREPVRKDRKKGKKKLPSDNAIVEKAAERGAATVRRHRKDVEKLRKLILNLVKKVYDRPRKTWVGQFQGAIITKSLKITATERSAAAHQLAGAYAKLVPLERQIEGLDDPDAKKDRPKEVVVNINTEYEE